MQRGDIDQIRKLVAGGANVNAQAAHGITPMDQRCAGPCSGVHSGSGRLEGVSGVKKALLAGKLKGCAALSQMVNR